jgi:tetratricopeptide (TPR) repeat protein
VNRAFTYEKLEKYEEALADFTQAIKLDSLNNNYYRYRAGCYDDLNDYNNSQMDWTMAINLAPKDEFDYLNYEFRAYSYMKNKKYDLAIADFTFIIKSDSANYHNGDDPYWYNIRGRMYLEMKEYNTAIKDFSKSLEFGMLEDGVFIPDTTYAGADQVASWASLAYNGRAQSYFLLGEYEKAKDNYLEAIRLDGENPESHYYLALFSMRENMTIKALSYFSPAIQYFSSSSIYSYNNFGELVKLIDIYHKRAELYSKEGYTELMCKDYEKACELGDCEAYEKNCD